MTTTENAPRKTGIVGLDGPEMRVAEAQSSVQPENDRAIVVVEAMTADPHIAALWLGQHRRASDIAVKYAADKGLRNPALTDAQGPIAVTVDGKSCAQEAMAGRSGTPARHRITFQIQGG